MQEKKFDIDKELQPIARENCFICQQAIDDFDIIFEDERFIAFLDKYPTSKAYTILAFKEHYEDITELSEKDYLDFQALLHKLSLAIKKAFAPDRICLLNSGGLLSHWHFHIVPVYGEIYNVLPKLLMKETILEISAEERRAICQEIKNNL